MRVSAALIAPLALIACSSEPDEPPIVPERDPATVQALGDQIMVDPDLAQQNEANAALTSGTDHSIPPVVATREAIDSARQEAADLVGGTSNLPDLPEATASDEAIPEVALYSVTELAKLTDGLATCADRSSFTAQWAARMPEAFPIYPQGNTLEAAGTDSGECSLRAVRFLTPVDENDVLSFYLARAKTAGIETRLTQRGAFKVLEGAKENAMLAVYTARRPSGIYEIGLVTSGF